MKQVSGPTRSVTCAFTLICTLPPPGFLPGVLTHTYSPSRMPRSAAAFGACGVVVPSRRSASVTASAWKSSAGALARLPVARVVNLTRALEAYKQRGLFVAGLDAEGKVDVHEMSIADGPMVLVVGSEGRGLSRIVASACDMVVRIPMASGMESLNAGIAAAQPGDTVQVAQGAYREQVSINRPLSLIGVNTANTLFDADGNNTSSGGNDTISMSIG